MRLNDWHRQAEEFRDIDREAQRQAEEQLTQATPAELELRGAEKSAAGQRRYLGASEGEPSAQTAERDAKPPTPIKFHDEQSAVESLVTRYFEGDQDFCREKCKYFHEFSETCEALEDGMAEVCPMCDELIEAEIRANQEDQAGCYP